MRREGFNKVPVVINLQENSPIFLFLFSFFYKLGLKQSSNIIRLFFGVDPELIEMLCHDLKRPLMLKIPSVELNWNNSAKKSGPNFLHSDARDSLPVITNTRLQILLPRMVQPVISLRQQFFIQGQAGVDSFLMNDVISKNLYFPFTQVLSNVNLCLFIWNSEI